MVIQGLVALSHLEKWDAGGIRVFHILKTIVGKFYARIFLFP